MDNQVYNSIVNFIWNIADDCLRDNYTRGKYRDVILPMTVIRRLDVMLEDSKTAVLDMKKMLDEAGIANQWPALCNAAGQAFCNASPFCLRDLTSRAKKQTLKADFEAYLDGFSPNVQEIMDKFKFRHQIDTMIEADILGAVIERFVSPTINTLFAKCEKGDGEGETNPLGLVLPKDWQIIKFNGFFNFGKGLNITKKDLQEEGIAVISYGQVHSKTNMGTEINDTLIRYVDESYVQTSPKALVNKGDFIFADTSEDFAGVGNCVFVDRDDTIFAGYHTLIARPKDGKEHRYLAYLFKSSLWRYQVRKKVNGVKVYSITQKILKNALIFLPPVPEQEEVIMFLDDKCKMLSCAIEQITREITSLQEMKKRLISDVVTGKIDVREIDIPEYSISLDDIDADMDDEYMEDEIDEEV